MNKRTSNQYFMIELEGGEVLETKLTMPQAEHFLERACNCDCDAYIAEMVLTDDQDALIESVCSEMVGITPIDAGLDDNLEFIERFMDGHHLDRPTVESAVSDWAIKYDMGLNAA